MRVSEGTLPLGVKPAKPAPNFAGRAQLARGWWMGGGVGIQVFVQNLEVMFESHEIHLKSCAGSLKFFFTDTGITV